MFAQSANNPDSPLKIGASYRIYPGSVDQTEVFIVKSPINQNILWVSCNTLNFIPLFISEGIFVTTDGGISWQGNDTCTGSPIAFHGGDPGIAIDVNGAFIITRLGRSPFVGLYSHYSTDNGQTWSAQKVISTDDLERASLATNDLPGTPGYGRTFAGWIKFAYPFPMMIAYTDNGAQSWSTPRKLNNPTNRSAGGDLAVGPGGEVYICWAGVTDVSPFKEILVGFASSLNGGADWSVTENVFPMNGITGELINKGKIRVNGLPGIAVDATEGTRKGWIYIVTGQKDLAPAGSDPDIVLNRSTDGGKTWSAGIRVNQDALNNGKTQYFPTVHVDKSGAVNVIFYDDRNTTNDSSGVFLARSNDGGETFREYEICDHHFKPRSIGYLGEGYQGDNIDITSTDTHLWPVWMDNSTGVYQIWTVPIKFSDVDGINEPKSGSESSLIRNFPNPFRDKTTFEYQVIKSGKATITVYDIYGRDVVTLVDEWKFPGRYYVDFLSIAPGIEKLISGSMYFYKYRINDCVESGKMVMIR
ncbi:MAG: hypothetical protein NT004_04560 [Bacteroidetes bacterium]|nr:hypothetical protein [Bacteroidota bacterium]